MPQPVIRGMSKSKDPLILCARPGSAGAYGSRPICSGKSIGALTCPIDVTFLVVCVDCQQCHHWLRMSLYAQERHHGYNYLY